MKVQVLINIVLITLISSTLSAQLPDGETAPNFEIMDINGISHNLYDILENGQSVVIDFSATWCGSCWNYHKTNALENVYASYGPSGTNELEVFWIDADANTNTACVTNSAGCNNNTKGDWTEDSEYTYFNLEDDELSVKDDYNINSYPTIIGITPNKKQYEIGKLTNLDTWQSWVQETFALDYTADVGPDFIDLTTIAGSGEISYNWSNGETTEDISDLSNGFYSCTITEGRGHSVETIAFQINSNGVSVVCPPNTDLTYCQVEDIPESLGLLDFFEAGGDILGQYDASTYSVSDELIGTGCPFILIRTYSVMDLSGGVVSCTQEFNIEDDMAPQISLQLPVNLLAQVDLNNSIITNISNYIQDGSINDDCGILEESLNLVSQESSNTACELITRTYSVSDYCGNTSTFIQEIYIELDDSVTASFIAEIEEATVDFESTSAITGDYLWTFGDGVSSDETNPSHTYEENGAYSVCCEITSPCGTKKTCEEIIVSGISSVTIEEILEFTLSPNPSSVNSHVTIQANEELEPELCIFFGNGVKTWRELKETGPLAYDFIIEDLSSGLYIVQVKSKVGRISTAKLLIL